MHFLSLIDWSKVAEWTIPAVLAFAFGYVLQAVLLRRQERFQKDLLKEQLSFLERLERERSERDAKADAERIAAERAIVGHLASTLRQNSLNERNHESRQRMEDRAELRAIHRDK
jgi:hypothetical protein